MDYICDDDETLERIVIGAPSRRRSDSGGLRDSGCCEAPLSSPTAEVENFKGKEERVKPQKWKVLHFCGRLFPLCP